MGKGGGNNTTTGTTYTSNIPEYAKPYVETMLGATQRQLFQGNDTPEGGFSITGFKPYQPYSTNAEDYIAGFSPLQQQAQQTVGGMQVPGQFGAASDITGRGIMGAAQVGRQAGSLYGMGNAAANAGNQYAQQATDPYSMAAYMSPYMQNVLQGQQNEAIRQSEIQRVANQGQATQAGAFGGSRQAIVEGERQRNLGTQLGGIQAQGLQNAFQNAQQAQQYGAGLNLQGLQAGAGMYGQGIGAQQAAINQTMQGAGQYAGLGAQELQAQQGIAGLQSQYGAQQQAMEQQKINQSIQDYANAQQYPLMQLGTMSNMLRGLPMQSQTTQQYVAAPNNLTQAIGTLGAGASIYNAFSPSGSKAEGGVIKSMAKGGITSVPSYDVGGEVESQLESMEPEELAKQAKESSSATVRRMAARLLREKQMTRAPQGAGPTGPMGIDYQAPQLAGGGIIAFAKPEEKNNYSLVEDSFMDRINAAASGPAEAGIPEPKATDLGAVPLRRYNELPEIAAMQTEADKQSAYAARDTADIVNEIKAQAGPNVGAQEQRAKLMSERANLADENQRQRNLRLAQFFAKWGSTAGPTLVAGMNALNEKLPDLLEDEKSFRKAKLELDRTMFDLDQATRLEALGNLKEARALKEKAAERAMHLNQYIGTNATQLKREEMADETRIKEAKIQAAGRASDKEYNYARLDFDKAVAGSNAAQNKLAAALSQVADSQAKDKSYNNAKKIVDEYNAMIERNKDKKNYKPEPQITADAKRAEETILKREAADEERLRILRKEAEDASQRLSNMANPRDKGKEKEKEKGKNQPTVSNWN